MTPPQTTLTGGPSGSVDRGPVSFTFVSSESGSRFECRIDGPGSVSGTFQSCASPQTYSSLADGSYTFAVRAIDAAGNIDATPATRLFTIVPPESPPAPVWPPSAPVITAPTSYSWTKTSAVVFGGTAAAGSTVELFDGSTSLGTTVATAAGAWTRQVVSLSDGAHLISAKAANLGGVSPASALRVIQVDTKAPVAPVIVSPSSGGVAPQAFTISGTVEAGTTIELFEDGMSRGTTAGAVGTWSRTLSGVKSGVHAYAARATDMAGNVSGFSATTSVHVTG